MRLRVVPIGLHLPARFQSAWLIEVLLFAQTLVGSWGKTGRGRSNGAPPAIEFPHMSPLIYRICKPPQTSTPARTWEGVEVFSSM
jgi:hypothetical protein